MGINTLEVDKTLEKMAFANERRFNAHQVTSLSKEKNVMEVNDYLLYRSIGTFGILNAKIETLCDNNHPAEHFDIGEPLPKYEVACHICENEYIPDLEYSHLVFYFRESFIADVKKKWLKQHHRVLAGVR